MKIKLLYIISLVESSHTFNITFKNIDKEKFSVSAIFMNPSKPELMKDAEAFGIKCFHVPYYKKVVKDLNVLISIIKVIRQVKPNIVHAHLIDGSFFGLLAAYICRVKHRFYTRHHSTYHWVYSPSSVKYDRIINFLSTKIIAVSELVKEVLVENENVPQNKIAVIHHGFDIENFEIRDENRIEKIRKRYDIIGLNPVIGVVSRFIEEKGIHYIIPAFKKFLESHPNALLILANAKGNYTPTILKLLGDIPKENYRIINFENDISALYHCFDCFIHVPINRFAEAFGQTYVEGMAAKVPCIFTRSGIAIEYIVNNHNAILIDFNSSDEIYDALMLLINDKNLREKIVDNGYNDVKRLFSISTIIKKLENQYEL